MTVKTSTVCAAGSSEDLRYSELKRAALCRTVTGDSAQLRDYVTALWGTKETGCPPQDPGGQMQCRGRGRGRGRSMLLGPVQRCSPPWTAETYYVKDRVTGNACVTSFRCTIVTYYFVHTYVLSPERWPHLALSRSTKSCLNFVGVFGKLQDVSFWVLSIFKVKIVENKRLKTSPFRAKTLWLMKYHRAKRASEPNTLSDAAINYTIIIS